jgi:hypothetical protein
VKEIQLDYHHGSSSNNGDHRELPITLFSRKVVPISEMTTTSAIFLLSEGLIISCNGIEKGRSHTKNIGCKSFFQMSTHNFLYDFIVLITAFNTWKKDPRRLVGFFGYKVPSEDTSGMLSSLQHITPGIDSYAFVSNRAVFIHKLYLDSLPAVGGYKDERHHGNCCDVSLSLQVSVAFDKPPVVVKANVVDLVEGPGGVRQQIIGTCDDECVPSWLQMADVHSIPHQHTAVLA